MRNFTIKDFEGSGQYLVKATNNEYRHYVDSGNLSTNMYKVGYLHGSEKGYPYKNIYSLISMSDGWVQDGYYKNKKYNHFISKYALVRYLNSSKLCKTEYRFATQEEVVRVVLYQKSRWKN